MPPHTVTVRRSDFKVRLNDVYWPSNVSQNTEFVKIKHTLKGKFDIVRGSAYAGTYVDFWDVVNLCQRYGLTALEKVLRTWDQQAPVKQLELPEFIEITDFANPVVVRRSNLRINANNIFKLAGYSRQEGMGLRKRIDSGVYDVHLKARGQYQGTYVDFDIGIELCREYGLHQLEQRLQSMKETSEGPMIAAEPGHTGSRSHTHLEESIGSEIIAGGPMQTEGACEPVPSIRCAKGAASSRQSSPKPRHSLLECANLPSHSAENVQYEVWDSRPQLSELTEVEPDLRPSSWKRASHYGSFGDLFTPI